MRVDASLFALRPKEWIWDMAVRQCSLTARGLYADLLCLMQEGQPFGHLTVRHDLLLALVNVPQQEFEALVSELERAGLVARTDSGVLYAPRMVRQQAKRAQLSANGAKGGRPPRSENGGVSDAEGRQVARP